MIHLLRTVTAQGFECKVWFDDAPQPFGRVFFVADLDVDGDGGVNIDHDPYWQPGTALHHEGKPIDALSVPAMVVPGWLPAAVKGIVLGSQGRLTNLASMDLRTDTVVHDTGPLNKVGEGTPVACVRLGLSGNANTGGENRNIILHEFWPGKPALVDGIQYALKPE